MGEEQAAAFDETTAPVIGTAAALSWRAVKAEARAAAEAAAEAEALAAAEAAVKAAADAAVRAAAQAAAEAAAKAAAEAAAKAVAEDDAKAEARAAAEAAAEDEARAAAAMAVKAAADAAVRAAAQAAAKAAARAVAEAEARAAEKAAAKIEEEEARAKAEQEAAKAAARAVAKAAAKLAAEHEAKAAAEAAARAEAEAAEAAARAEAEAAAKLAAEQEAKAAAEAAAVAMAEEEAAARARAVLEHKTRAAVYIQAGEAAAWTAAAEAAARAEAAAKRAAEQEAKAAAAAAAQAAAEAAARAEAEAAAKLAAEQEAKAAAEAAAVAMAEEEAAARARAVLECKTRAGASIKAGEAAAWAAAAEAAAKAEAEAAANAIKVEAAAEAAAAPEEPEAGAGLGPEGAPCDPRALAHSLWAREASLQSMEACFRRGAGAGAGVQELLSEFESALPALLGGAAGLAAPAPADMWESNRDGWWSSVELVDQRMELMVKSSGGHMTPEAARRAACAGAVLHWLWSRGAAGDRWLSLLRAALCAADADARVALIGIVTPRAAFGDAPAEEAVRVARLASNVARSVPWEARSKSTAGTAGFADVIRLWLQLDFHADDAPGSFSEAGGGGPAAAFKQQRACTRLLDIARGGGAKLWGFVAAQPCVTNAAVTGCLSCLWMEALATAVLRGDALDEDEEGPSVDAGTLFGSCLAEAVAQAHKFGYGHMRDHLTAEFLDKILLSQQGDRRDVYLREVAAQRGAALKAYLCAAAELAPTWGVRAPSSGARRGGPGVRAAAAPLTPAVMLGARPEASEDTPWERMQLVAVAAARAFAAGRGAENSEAAVALLRLLDCPPECFQSVNSWEGDQVEPERWLRHVLPWIPDATDESFRAALQLLVLASPALDAAYGISGVEYPAERMLEQLGVPRLRNWPLSTDAYAKTLAYMAPSWVTQLATQQDAGCAAGALLLPLAAGMPLKCLRWPLPQLDPFEALFPALTAASDQQLSNASAALLTSGPRGSPALGPSWLRAALSWPSLNKEAAAAADPEELAAQAVGCAAYAVGRAWLRHRLDCALVAGTSDADAIAQLDIVLGDLVRKAPESTLQHWREVELDPERARLKRATKASAADEKEFEETADGFDADESSDEEAPWAAEATADDEMAWATETTAAEEDSKKTADGFDVDVTADEEAPWAAEATADGEVAWAVEAAAAEEDSEETADVFDVDVTADEEEPVVEEAPPAVAATSAAGDSADGAAEAPPPAGAREEPPAGVSRTAEDLAAVLNAAAAPGSLAVIRTGDAAAPASEGLSDAALAAALADPAGPASAASEVSPAPAPIHAASAADVAPFPESLAGSVAEAADDKVELDIHIAREVRLLCRQLAQGRARLLPLPSTATGAAAARAAAAAAAADSDADELLSRLLGTGDGGKGCGSGRPPGRRGDHLAALRFLDRVGARMPAFVVTFDGEGADAAVQESALAWSLYEALWPSPHAGRTAVGPGATAAESELEAAAGLAGAGRVLALAVGACGEGPAERAAAAEVQARLLRAARSVGVVRAGAGAGAPGGFPVALLVPAPDASNVPEDAREEDGGEAARAASPAASSAAGDDVEASASSSGYSALSDSDVEGGGDADGEASDASVRSGLGPDVLAWEELPHSFLEGFDFSVAPAPNANAAAPVPHEAAAPKRGSGRRSRRRKRQRDAAGSGGDD